MDRKAELEKKRKKLEELRKAREAKQLAGRSTNPVVVKEGERERERQDVSDLVTSLLGEPLPSLASTGLSAGSQSTTPPVLSSVGVSAADMSSQPLTKAVVNLSTCEAYYINVPPQEVVVYEKGAQTEEWLLREALAESMAAQAEAQSEEVQEDDGRDTNDVHEQGPSDGEHQTEEAAEHQPTQLVEEQARAVMESEEFQNFFLRSSKLVERALNEPYDVAVDYSGLDEELNGVDKAGRELMLLHGFASDRHTKHRASSFLEWSPKYPELFLSAYTQDDTVASEPGGMVLVWSTHLRDRPEFVFQWQSPILSACFTCFNPNLILGGSYSGQVLLWDNRAKSAPVQRTTLSTKAHAHPIYGMQVVGTQNAHNLVTVSTDGRLCSWLLDMLAEPQDTMDIRGVAATSLVFPDNDVNNFIVGGEDGAVHLGSRLNSNAGTVQAQAIAGGHAGPVTSVSCHPAAGETDFSDYVLSSSTDWSIKLWARSSKKLVHSFAEGSDYVYCVQWSPTHPSVFASVDGSSRLCVWDINENPEAPVATVQVSKRGIAANQLRWSADGRRIIVGDADGNVTLYRVGELLSVPKADAWGRLRDSAKELMTAQYTTDPHLDMYSYMH